MAGFGYLLEIAGLPYALATSSNAPVQFGQTVWTYLMDVPQSASIRCELIEGTSETGGASFRCVNISNDVSTHLFTGLKRSPRTRLTADLDSSSLTINVEKGSDFSGSSYLYIGKETIEISSTAATSITATLSGRGMFGSEAREHKQYNAIDGGQYPLVYGYVPALKGRRAWLWRYKLTDPSDKVIAAAGYIHNAQWHPDGSIDIDLHSMQQRLMDAQVLSQPYAKGQLLFDEDTTLLAIDGLEIQLENPDLPFPAPNFYQEYCYILLKGDGGDTELIGYKRINRTVKTATTIAGSTTKLLAFNSTSGFRKGDLIEVGAGGERSQVSEVASASQLRLTSELSSAPAAGITINVLNRMQLLPPLKRAGAGIIDLPKVELKNGLSIEEIRILEDDQIEVFLKLLLSREGTTVNTSRDNYPEGWGAGVGADEVDITSFEDLRERSAGRRYAVTESMNLWDMAQWMMRSMACYIYTNRAGKLHARLARPLYPNDTAALAATIANVSNDLVELDASEDRVRNMWEWAMDRPLLEQSGEPNLIHRMQQPDSKALYDERALDRLEDPGLGQDSQMQALAVGEIMWSRVAHVQPRIRFAVAYDLAQTIEPGDHIDLTWPHMPDFAGAAGVSNSLFEVLAANPTDADNRIEIEAQLVTQGPYGLIAPAARVNSTLGSNVILEPQSTTLLSQAGTEDVQHWSAGDTVRFVDYSSLSTGTVVTATTTISAVNVPGRFVTVASVPGWLVTGDLMLPGDYGAWSGRNTSSELNPQMLWQTAHVFAADETASPVVLGSSDDPFEYGG